jgi:DNA invertase Pin-like site-specific DNA recombinase
LGRSTILVTALDRIGRSVQHVSAFLPEMNQLGIAMYFHREAIDSSTPTGRAMLSMCSVFAELERDLIRERTIAGLARARAQGTKSGKAIGRPPLPPETSQAIQAALASGQGVRATARALGVSPASVVRARREATAISSRDRRVFGADHWRRGWVSLCDLTVS